MRGRNSRFALMGVLALAATLMLGLVSGSVAEAKKKGKKGGNSLTVGTTGPVTVPPSTPLPAGCDPNGGGNPCTGQKTSFVAVPLAVGKKAKGKVVSPESVSVTYALSGDPRRPNPNPPPPGPFPFPTNDIAAGASALSLSITAPNGRTIGVDTPDDPNATTVGPVTETANSPFTFCGTNFAFPFPATTTCSGQDPDEVVGPPAWTGTIGNPELSDFSGLGARGTWTVRVRNGSTMSTGVVSSFSLQIPLQVSSGGGGKK
jgi:hypothetical protein